MARGHELAYNPAMLPIAAAVSAKRPLQGAEVDAALSNSRLVSVCETTNPDEAQAILCGVYGPHALRVGHEGSLALKLRGAEFARLHLGEVRYGTPTRMAMPRAHGHWVFSYLRQGEVWRSADQARYGAGDAGVMAPDEVQGLEMSGDMELLNLRVADADMAGACRALLGSDLAHPLRFADRCGAGGAPVAALLRVLGHLAATPAYPHVAAQRLEASLRDAALFELLLAWPNSYTRGFDSPAALPPSTKRARDYIHAHAADVPSVADIAAAAGVGVRALARGFERHFGVSPQRYLQQYRLDRVREELRAAVGSGTTVTAIAAQWGFWQLGSFAARYRERFGESPSQTLNRRGSSESAQRAADTP
ncbi:AraC family transcriptional regulator [Roseateles saccharophilus]|uniref:AraC-like DNA-binding protein n=2 Tax=Roseateles saccharophilus TaxID=304 RepID=A0A4R3UF09_ROSSA|nr:AraC-like DNA-binding protein [Roseateles saccharophilus]